MATDREFLRHTLATLAYRGAKATRGCTPEAASFRAGPTTRTPLEILAHIGDLMDWGLSMAAGKEKWNDAKPLPWDDEVKRFHAALQALDDYLASEARLAVTPERIFQGPIADALAHVGQINTLRRIGGAPVKGENYSRAGIETGRVGADQKPANPRNEFN
ncbi:MAG: hypothetical protein ACM3PF_00250 [Bacteroidota bacterium]